MRFFDKKLTEMIYQNLVRYFSLAFLFLALSLGAQAQDAKHGKELFLANCASCHNANMKDNATGPALGDVEARWAEFPQEELYAWIRNSQGLIADNSAASQAYAADLYKKWGSVMTPFPALTDADIQDMLVYIQNKYEFGCDSPPCVTAVAEGGNEGPAKEEDSSTGIILIILAVVLALSTVFLARYINNLNRLAAQKTGGEPVASKSFLQIVLNPTIVRLLIFALVIFGGYTTVNNAINLGRQQNYAPEQPIKFSHALHAGKNGIDCQYCHDGARRSKHAVIPAMNTCMNCHTAVKKGPEHGTAEILKIYASTGFNPISIETPQYGAYFSDTVSLESRLAVYEKWLKASNEGMAEGDIKAQLAAVPQFIETSEDSKLVNTKPVSWIRIHNLPDHVYFNHSQHVTAGKVECQDCHGAVEEMAVVKQHAPLSMGWCVNCHRQTKVKFDENAYYQADYYKQYEEYHKEIQEGGVTVEEIGGLECQKCHY